MRRATPLVLIVLTACGARYRKEIVGSGAAGGAPVQVTEGGLHKIDVTIYAPRAMRVGYHLTCGAETASGVIGETFADYRSRRLAELQRQRERDKQAVGAVTGAILGQVGARGQVETAGASADVEATVDGEAVGEAVAEQTLPQPQLDPRDTGGGILRTSVTLDVERPGPCTLALDEPDDQADGETIAGARGDFRVTRWIDRHAEKRAIARAANSRAVELRGQLRADLVARGADPELQIKLRAQAQADARLELDRALAARGAVISWLGECGGEPYRKQRLRRERIERRRQAHRLALDLRGELRAELIGRGADPDYRRKLAEAEMREYEARLAARAAADVELTARARAAMDVRSRLALELQALGAIDRPPRPAPRQETRPPSPRADAVWIAGEWRWSGGAWAWLAGSWAIPPRSDAIWVAPVEVRIGGRVTVRPGGWVDRSSGSRVRDHRKPTPAPPTAPTAPTAPAAPQPATTVRDHRDSDDDDQPTVRTRDHRKQ